VYQLKTKTVNIAKLKSQTHQTQFMIELELDVKVLTLKLYSISKYKLFTQLCCNIKHELYLCYI